MKNVSMWAWGDVRSCGKVKVSPPSATNPKFIKGLTQKGKLSFLINYYSQGFILPLLAILTRDMKNNVLFH